MPTSTPAPNLAMTFTSTGSASLSASTTTSNTALGSTGALTLVTNGGSVSAYVALGGSTVTATTTGYGPGSVLVRAGQTIILQTGGATYLAGITASSTASLTISTGNQAGISATFTPSGTQDVKVKQVGATPVLVGAGATGAGSQRTTVAQDSTTVAGSASLPTGSNTIGNVGLNASNCASLNHPAFSCSVTIQATFSPQTAGAYVIGNSYGPLLTFNVNSATGLTLSGAAVRVQRISTIVTATTSFSAAPSVNGLIFNSLPAGTFTDGSAVAWNTADNTAFKSFIATSPNSGITGVTGAQLAVGTATPATDIVLDSGGKFYLGQVILNGIRRLRSEPRRKG